MIMTKKFYAKSPGNEGYIKNMEVVGFHDLNGVMAFQMALQKVGARYYLYCGSFKGPGWNILEVTDPAHPRHVKWLEACDPQEYPATNTPKIQIADGLMLAALGGGIPLLHGGKPDDKSMGGLMIFDVKTDPENPKLLSHWETGVKNGIGVHRFYYNGGRYAHLSADCPGYMGMIYRILDIQDPTNPVEVGRWWLPEQFIDGMLTGTYPSDHFGGADWLDYAGMHGPAYVVGDKAYLSYGGAGMCILDISDVTQPKLLGRLTFRPPFAGKLSGARCHTVLPLTGRDFAVVTNEGERFPYFTKEIINGVAQPMNNLHMVDVHDPTNPTLVAEFPYPEVPADFPYPNFNDCGIGAQGPFGPHNLHEPMGKPWLEDNPNRVYCCYFHAGMRVYDVSDPYYIKEVAYFIPPNPEKKLFEVPIPGKMIGTTEDCIVDDRGYIYMDTFHDGLYILRMKEE
jgi:hypothetical protein